jgi:hypothetical protein
LIEYLLSKWDFQIGHLGAYRTGKDIPIRIYKDNKIVAYYSEIYFSWYSGMLYEPIGLIYNRNSKKLVRFALPAVISRKGRTAFPFNIRNQLRESYCIMPIEFSFGVFYGFRFGFNPHEFVDFLLGFAGIDILDDDANNDSKSEFIYVEKPLPSLLPQAEYIFPEIRPTNMHQGFCSTKTDTALNCRNLESIASCEIDKKETVYYFPKVFNIESAKKDCRMYMGKFSVRKGTKAIP